jgi:hypothetical protein
LVEESVVYVDASVFLEEERQYYLYNDVRFPEIPEDFITQYPYAVILQPADSTEYKLYMSTVVFYEYVQYGTEKLVTAGSKGLIYKFKDGNPCWLFAGEGTMPTTDLRKGATVYTRLVWSNHNIPSGSATATDIYFAGSEPVPTE